MTEKINRVLKYIRRSWITIWMVIMALVLASVLTYAAYTRVSTVKRVVSTKDGSGLLFSSDYMATGTKYVTEHGNYDAYTGNQNPTYTFVVSNYAQGNRHTWYNLKDIEYTLSARIVKNEKYTSEDTDDSDLIGTFKPVTIADLSGKVFKIGIKGQSLRDFLEGQEVKEITFGYTETGKDALSKNQADDDFFEIVIDKSELLNNTPSLLIELIATPKEASGGEVETIYGYVGACRRPSSDAEWSGKISDVNTSGEGHYDYDAFNYVISGNGSGTFYFAYDSSKVSLNEFSLVNYADDIDETRNIASSDWSNLKKYKETQPVNPNDWKIVVLSVDSEDPDKNSRYSLQLYKTPSGETIDYTQIADFVDYGFVKAATNVSQGNGDGGDGEENGENNEP